MRGGLSATLSPITSHSIPRSVHCLIATARLPISRTPPSTSQRLSCRSTAVCCGVSITRSRPMARGREITRSLSPWIWCRATAVGSLTSLHPQLSISGRAPPPPPALHTDRIQPQIYVADVSCWAYRRFPVWTNWDLSVVSVPSVSQPSTSSATSAYERVSLPPLR